MILSSSSSSILLLFATAASLLPTGCNATDLIEYTFGTGYSPPPPHTTTMDTSCTPCDCCSDDEQHQSQQHSHDEQQQRNDAEEQQHRAEVKEILDNDTFDSLYEWSIGKSCLAIYAQYYQSIRDKYSQEIVELKETAENICDQYRVQKSIFDNLPENEQNDNFGMLSRFYTTIIHQMRNIGPQIIEQLKKKEEEEEEQIQSSSQNANQQEEKEKEETRSINKFGTDLEAFAMTLPEGRAKRALVELVHHSKLPLLPIDLLSLLLNKLIATDQEVPPMNPPPFLTTTNATSGSNSSDQIWVKRRKRRMALAPVLGGFMLILALMCQAIGNGLLATYNTALAFIQLYDGF